MRSARHPGAAGLADRVAASPVEPAGPPTPAFADLADRLAAAGIWADLAEGHLTLGWAEPQGDVLPLVQPVPHPWLPERGIETELGNPAATPMMVSAWQIQEVVKIIVGQGSLLRGRALIMDAEFGEVTEIQLS